MEQNKDFKLSNDKKTLLKYEGNSSRVFIPEGVEIIKESAFENNSAIKVVYIPFSIKEVQIKAFVECENLKAVRCKGMPVDYSGCSLCNCKGLNEPIIHYGYKLIRVPQSTSGKYTIPEGVEIISKGAFCNCSLITELVIPNGVKRIDELAFNGLTNLEVITIPASVESIGERAFIDCGRVKRITVDKSNPKYDSRDNCNAIVETELNRIIFGCSETTFVDSITSIGEYAFAYCSELKVLKIPESITDIKAYAFGNCNNLIFAELPSSLKSVEHNIFDDCKKLVEVYLNEGIEEIDFRAFEGCESLTKINIPDTFIPQKENNFYCLNALVKSIQTPIYNKNIFVSLPQSFSGHYTIPEGITTILGRAFWRCDNLTGVTLPQSIKEISDSAFHGCSKLSKVLGSEMISILRKRAFKKCFELSLINLSNVEILESHAFHCCNNLSNVVLNDSVSISGNPFQGCPNINIKSFNGILFRPDIPEDGHYILPSAIKKIAPCAFEDCTTLKSITIPNGVEIGEKTFAGCVNLVSVILPNDLKVFPYALFKGCKALKQVELPPSIEVIEESVFMDCESLETITIPKSVSELRGQAFSGCINLSQVNWEKLDSLNLTEIGPSAFERCRMLLEIQIPIGVSKIYSNAFKDCQNLRKIQFWCSSLELLGESAFDGCTSLQSINIPDGLIDLEANTFRNCKSLWYIKVPRSINTINTSSFRGCNNIKIADLPLGWLDKREKLGLPPERSSGFIYDDDIPLSGLGATEDGPMICSEDKLLRCPYCGSYSVQSLPGGKMKCYMCRRWCKHKQS